MVATYNSYPSNFSIVIYKLFFQDNSVDEAAGLSRNNKPVLPAGVQQSPPVVSSWNITSKVCKYCG